MLHPKISPRWSEPVVVAASGPSLTKEVARACAGFKTLVVNDAYLLFPDASALYACDEPWWELHKGCTEFAGEKWSSHGDEKHNDKRQAAERYGLNLVRGKTAEGFSLNPSLIHYGSNSGFQGINLAGLLTGWQQPIILVGFDMRVNGKRHFFGDHPQQLSNRTDYIQWVPEFERAQKLLPPHVEIINATPGSAIKCFRQMELADALSYLLGSGSAARFSVAG